MFIVFAGGVHMALQEVHDVDTKQSISKALQRVLAAPHEAILLNGYHVPYPIEVGNNWVEHLELDASGEFTLESRREYGTIETR